MFNFLLLLITVAFCLSYYHVQMMIICVNY